MIYTILISSILASLAAADNFAVLVAGSDGYYNYRHQSDVYHAYHLFLDNGFPAENIIVMHKDDIANSRQNPKPGQVFNVVNGTNVYYDIPKHYVGNDVAPKNFLAALSGDSKITKGKPVLKTTEKDNIFVYFTDHGSPGLIAFPNEYLYADALNKTLEHMYAKKKYAKLVFYLETCESGSMFNKILRDDINVYAHTAATPYQSSYACDYSRVADAYLNDCWSRNWMVDTETNPLEDRTLQDQFDIVHQKTTQSISCAYGDLSIAKDKLVVHLTGSKWRKPKTGNSQIKPFQKNSDMVSSRDVVLETLKRQLEDRPHDEDLKAALDKEMESRAIAQMFFTHLNSLMFTQNEVGFDTRNKNCYSRSLTNYDCLRQTVGEYEKNFGKFTDFSLQFVSDLYDLCSPESGIDSELVVEMVSKTAAEFAENLRNSKFVLEK